MKKFVLTMVTAMFIATSWLSAQTSSEKEQVSWKSKEHSFGSIPRNKPVTATFEFTNNTDRPVVITDVKTSCGCTKGDYPREPVAPGAKASVSAVFNAANPGTFNKSVTVAFADGLPQASLYIKGSVVE